MPDIFDQLDPPLTRPGTAAVLGNVPTGDIFDELTPDHPTSPQWAYSAGSEIDRLESAGQKLDPLAKQAIVRKFQHQEDASAPDVMGRVVTDERRGYSLPAEEATRRQLAAQDEQNQDVLTNAGSALLQNLGGAAQGLIRTAGSLGVPGAEDLSKDLNQSQQALYGEATGVSGAAGNIAGSILTSVAAGPAALPVFMATGYGQEQLAIDEQRRMGKDIGKTAGFLRSAGVGLAEGIFERYLGFPALKNADEVLKNALPGITKGIREGSIEAVKTALKESAPAAVKAGLKGAQEEALTSLAQDLIRQGTTGEDITVGEMLENALASGAAGAVGAFGGGALHAGIGSPHTAIDETTEQPISPPGETQSITEKVADVIAPKQAERRRDAERAANTDPLTGVANRRALDLALPSAEADAATSVISFDANNFGQVNKLKGEAEGDVMLKNVGAALSKAAAEVDPRARVFRKGGDEFVILASQQHAEQIRKRAEEFFGEHDVSGTLGDGSQKSVKVSLTGTIGNTFEEANAKLQQQKAIRKGQLNPQVTPADQAKVQTLLGRQTDEQTFTPKEIGVMDTGSQDDAKRLVTEATTTLDSLLKQGAKPGREERYTAEVARLNDRVTRLKTRYKTRFNEDFAGETQQVGAKTEEVKTEETAHHDLRQEFEQKGVGHKKLARDLDEMHREGTVSDLGRDIIMAAMMDTNTDFLFTINTKGEGKLKRSGMAYTAKRILKLRKGMARTREGRGQNTDADYARLSQEMNEAKTARNEAREIMRTTDSEFHAEKYTQAYRKEYAMEQKIERIVRQMERIKPSDKGLSSYLQDPAVHEAVVYLHEFGHIAQYNLLTQEENRLVREVYGSKTRTEWAKFFQEGLVEQVMGESAKKIGGYYAKNPDEFLVQSFAEYVLTRKASDSRLKPLLERMVERFKKALNRLRGRPSIDRLIPIYEKMLAGKIEGAPQRRHARGRGPGEAAPPMSPTTRQNLLAGSNPVTGPHRRLMARGLEDFITPISSRIRDISPKIFNRLKQMTFRANSAAEKLKKELHDMATEITAALGGNKDTKYKTFKKAVLNSERDAARAMLPANLHAGFDAFYTTFRTLIDNMKDAGMEMGDLGEDYWARFMTGHEAFRDLIGDDRGEYEVAFDEARKLKGRQLLTSDEEAEIANRVNNGFGPVKPGSRGPSIARTRRLASVDDTTVDMYGDPFDAAFRYIDNATYAAERARFLGKNAGPNKNVQNLDESVGRIIADEVSGLTQDQQDELHDLVKSRFTADMLSMSKGWRRIKEAVYLTTLGQFRSSLTQLTDAALTAASYGVKNMAKGFGSSIGKNRHRNQWNLMNEDLGIHQYGEEFKEVGAVGKAINKVFKVTGFARLDRLGKETRANASLRYMEDAATNLKSVAYRRLSREYVPVLGKAEFDATLADVRAHKKTERVRYLAFLEVSKIQPIGLEEMPKKYLDMPNGRILYALKTFTLKQMDFVRREMVRKLRSPATAKEGLRDLARYALFFGITRWGVEALKDWLRGRPLQADNVPDVVIDSILGMVGLNKYNAERFIEDPVGAVVDLVTPPHNLVSDPYTDIKNLLKGKIDDKGIRTLRNVPIIGELVYNWTPIGNGWVTNRENVKRQFNAGLKEMREEAKEALESDDRPRARADLRLYNDARKTHWREEMTKWRAEGRKGKMPPMPQSLTITDLIDRKDKDEDE